MLSVWFSVRNRSLVVASPDAVADSSFVRVSIVFFLRNYSMKRTIVQEGKKTTDGETPSGAITPTTQEGDGEPPQTVEEERRMTLSDIEKGSNESEDRTVDVRHEKPDTS